MKVVVFHCCGVNYNYNASLSTHTLKCLVDHNAHIDYVIGLVGGFRDTYLGRQVVSSPGGPRAGMRSAEGMGSAASSPSGVWGGAPAEIEFGAFLALKSAYDRSIVCWRFYR